MQRAGTPNSCGSNADTVKRIFSSSSLPYRSENRPSGGRVRSKKVKQPAREPEYTPRSTPEVGVL